VVSKKSIFPEQKDEYLGNMWGWKFSFVGLALLLLMLLLMGIRYYQINGDSAGDPIEMKEVEAPTR
jgi:predicted MFS family arabinose efflux permease